MKLRAVVLMVLVSAVVAVDCSVNISPASAATSLPAHQFNICGNMCWNGNLTSSDRLLWWVSISNPKPIIITANEVCSPQYTHMQSSLEQQGYTAYRNITVSVGGSCGQYGNAMFMLGTRVTDSSIVQPYYEKFYDQQAGEVRAYRCQRVIYNSTYFTGCVTHLTPNSSSVASAQAQESHNVENFMYGGDRRFMGGDFNQQSPPLWYGDCWEVDPGYHDTWPASAPSAKYDYVFGGGGIFAPGAAGAAYCDAAVSDHCYLAGAFSY